MRGGFDAAPIRQNQTKTKKKPMANKSAPGILTDCKQLLALTYDIINSLSNRDRVLVGDALMAANIGMVLDYTEMKIAPLRPKQGRRPRILLAYNNTNH